MQENRSNMWWWCMVALLAAWGCLPLSCARAADCRKAKEYYDRGVKLVKYEERQKAFQGALNLCPSFVEAHVNLADALENLALTGKAFNDRNLHRNNKFLDLAIKEYQEALKHDPRLFEAHLGLAEDYVRIGLYLKARDAYVKALEVNPHHNLAFRAKQGLDALQRAISADKDGFKKAKEIVQRFKESSGAPGVGRMMGFEDTAVVRDRQRFINIVFDEWSYQLNRKETIQQLEEIGEALGSSDLAKCKFIVEGHTDPRGGYERNQRLSEQRAEAVKEFLNAYSHIDSSRITTQGFGYDRPRFLNDSKENMLRNRRVELLIVEEKDEN